MAAEAPASASNPARHAPEGARFHGHEPGTPRFVRPSRIDELFAQLDHITEQLETVAGENRQARREPRPPRRAPVGTLRGGSRLAHALGFGLAFVMPAMAGAALYQSLSGEDSAKLPRTPAAQLAQLADQPRQLRPIVIRHGRGTLGTPPLQPIEGTGPRPAPPVRLSIPAADVAARVDRVAQVRSGISIPPVGRAGWFSGGARPGEAGRAVIVGHLDTRKGPGLFAKLPGLARGSQIAVTDATGRAHRFEVVGRTVVKKSHFPADAVYGSSHRPVLVLVTCGGPWREGRGYRDNVIVYARAV